MKCGSSLIIRYSIFYLTVRVDASNAWFHLGFLCLGGGGEELLEESLTTPTFVRTLY